MNHSKDNIGRTLGATLIACALMVCIAPPGWGQQQLVKEQVVGAWNLVSIEVTSKDGTKRPGFGGPNAKGILILDASGRYAQVTGNPERPKLSTTVRKDIPAAELGEAARSFGARYGAWRIDGADKTLLLTSELPMFTEQAGIERKLAVSVMGQELKLVESQAGSTTEFVFRRAR